MAGSKSSTASAPLGYLAFNFVSTVALTLINKACFSRVEFGFPAMLCNIHFCVTLLGVEIMRRMGLFEALPQSKIGNRDINFIAIVLVVGVVTPLNNTSLKLNGIGFYQVFKLLVTPMVVLLEYFLNGKVLSTLRAFWLTMVCLLVFISSRADLNFSVWGFVSASIWVPLAAIYKVQWGRVLKIHSCSTLALMYAVLPYAIVVQVLISPLVDPPGIFDFVWTSEAIFWIGLSGLMAFLVNFSGFLVIGNLGGLAHVLLGQFKSSVIMVGAYFMFHSRYSSLQLAGALGAVCAIVAYTHVTISEKEKKQHDEESDATLPLQHNHNAEK